MTWGYNYNKYLGHTELTDRAIFRPTNEGGLTANEKVCKIRKFPWDVLAKSQIKQVI